MLPALRRSLFYTWGCLLDPSESVPSDIHCPTTQTPFHWDHWHYLLSSLFHILDLNWLPSTKIFFVTITDLTGTIACWKMALNLPFEYHGRKSFSCGIQLWQDNTLEHLTGWLCPCDKNTCKYWGKQGKFAFTNLVLFLAHVPVDEIRCLHMSCS